MVARPGAGPVIRYDLPGFGLTGPDPSRDYTDGRSIAVLVALMDRLGVARASVVGNSMGGRIAWTFAALNPKRVDKLVLISPDGFASPGLEYGVAPRTPLMMRALPFVLPSFMLRPSLAAAYANPDVLTDALFRHYRDMMLPPGVRGAIVDRMSQQVLVNPAPLIVETLNDLGYQALETADSGAALRILQSSQRVDLLV